MTLHLPHHEAEAAQIIRETTGPLALSGNGSKAGLGRPVPGDGQSVPGDGLSARALSGISFYEPSEMVIGAKAGTSLAEIEAAIAEKGQMLPFEPVRLSPIYGPGEPSIGGIVACNLSGPRRIAVGAARDSVIGVTFVNGVGEIIRSGGRVMKNVTGLDMVKVQCGAHGTLGFLTHVVIKLLPKPELSTTLVLKGLEDGAAIAVLSRALGSPYEVSGAAHLPAGLGRDYARTCIRIENFSASVRYRIGELQKYFNDLATCHLLEGEPEARLWQAIGAGEFIASGERVIWKISCPPSSGAALMAQMQDLGGAYYYDWGGGLVWLALDEAHEQRLRASLAPLGGHATLMRAPVALRQSLPVFEPLSPALMQLTRKVKASFDPKGVLNFGKMYEGV